MSLDEYTQKPKSTFVDGLENDTNVNGLKYVIVSTLSSEKLLKCDTFGIKIRGFEDNEQKAEEKADLLRKKDKYFDVFVGLNGSWHPMIPTSTQIENEKFKNKDLNKIMKTIHESEKKKELEKELKDETKEEVEELEKELLEKPKEKTEDDEDLSLLENTTFMYSDEDCLDEDTPILDQRYAILSFISPELAENINERAFKVRGHSVSLQKALQLVKKIEEVDKNFNLVIVEIGKWVPVKFKLMKLMCKYDDETKVNKQNIEMGKLNEMIGRYKTNLDGRKEKMQQRKEAMIKEGASKLGEKIPETELLENNSEAVQELGKNREKTTERLRKMISETKTENKTESKTETKTETDENLPKKNHLGRESKADMIKRMKQKVGDKKREDEIKKISQDVTDNKKAKITQEVTRLNEKKQNIEKMKEDKEKLEANLKKMREMLEKRAVQ